jgi:tRNA(fMet)-specific endonuclease VapC
MSRLRMLDTDIISYVIKNRSLEIQQRFAELPPSSLCISTVTRAELLYGLRRLPPSHPLHFAVRRFLKTISTLAWDSTAADYWADIRFHLEKSGNLIGHMDMMIAAHSLSAGAILVTNNTRHFSRIEAPLILENWSKS